MGEIIKQVIKKKGNFDYTDLYIFSFDWLEALGYIIHEKQYLERQSDYGKEVQLKWEAYRKINDYYKFVIKFEWHIIGLSDVETEVNGKKVKTNKGDLKLTIKGSLDNDYEGRWSQNSFYKQMHDVYQRYVARLTTEEHEKLIVDDCLRLIGVLKSKLELI